MTTGKRTSGNVRKTKANVDADMLNSKYGGKKKHGVSRNKKSK